MVNQNVLLYGREELPPAPLTLKAGDLTMVFEPDTAFLRYIRFGDEEMVRSIYAVARDQNWNTIPWQVENLKSNLREDSFEITFDVECSDGPVRYSWNGIITGKADGTVSYSFDGVAQSDFLRNRIGICVLHPVKECAGKPCTVEHTKGDVEETSFPQHIAPWQPLRDVAAITHQVASKVSVEVRFAGDVFETEDQRNFGDASFKTYSTPQDLPKPVAVKKGDRVQHRVVISLRHAAEIKANDVLHRSPPKLVVGKVTLAKPAIGLQIAKDGGRLSESELDRIRALRLAHLRVDLMLAGSEWKNRLRDAADESISLNVPLQVALHVGADADNELAAFVREATTVRPRVNLWIIQRHGETYPTSSTLALAQERLSALGSVAIAGAASPFFIEVNRNRPAADSKVMLCIPMTPQIHLTDRNTLIENAADIREMIESARTLSSQPVVISPVTLRRAEPKASVRSNALPPTVDARQMSLFGAAWSLAHLSHVLTSAGLHSATYYETIGWRGVMEAAAGSSASSQFPSIPGAVFPAYHVFADLADVELVLPATATLPLQLAGVALQENQGRRRILLANLQPCSQTVQVEIGNGEAQVRRLNATNAEAALTQPEKFRKESQQVISSPNGIIEINLSAYEYARLDLSA